MEYPPWGLVSCWGRKLLGVKVPPPDTGVWEMGAVGSEKKLGSPGYPGASLSLVRPIGGRAQPPDLYVEAPPAWGGGGGGKGGVCVSS